MDFFNPDGRNCRKGTKEESERKEKEREKEEKTLSSLSTMAPARVERRRAAALSQSPSVLYRDRGESVCYGATSNR